MELKKELFDNIGLEDDLELVTASKQIRDLAEQYFNFYEEVKELKAHLQASEKIFGMIKGELINAMDGLGMKSYNGLDSATLTRSARQFIKVVDFKGLSTYIEDILNEPLDEYGSFKFDNDKLKPLVDTAKQKMLREAIPLEEALPIGIELAFTDIISVKAKKE